MQAVLEQKDLDGVPASRDAGRREGVSLEWQRVAELLGRKYDRIDAVQALSLLPLQVTAGLLPPALLTISTMPNKLKTVLLLTDSLPSRDSNCNAPAALLHWLKPNESMD